MATRGKEVQDFIKSQKKTARQLFEEAGWTYDGRTGGFDYTKEVFEDSDEYNIRFCHYDRSVTIDDGDEFQIDIETLKLIFIQCKELGWLK